jgi:hypothetical protein
MRLANLCGWARSRGSGREAVLILIRTVSRCLSSGGSQATTQEAFSLPPSPLDEAEALWTAL